MKNRRYYNAKYTYAIQIQLVKDGEWKHLHRTIDRVFAIQAASRRDKSKKSGGASHRAIREQDDMVIYPHG